MAPLNTENLKWTVDWFAPSRSQCLSFVTSRRRPHIFLFLHEHNNEGRKQDLQCCIINPLSFLKAQEMSIPGSAFDMVISMQPFIKHTSTDTVAASIHGISAKPLIKVTSQERTVAFCQSKFRSAKEQLISQWWEENKKVSVLNRNRLLYCIIKLEIGLKSLAC